MRFRGVTSLHQVGAQFWSGGTGEVRPEVPTAVVVGEGQPVSLPTSYGVWGSAVSINYYYVPASKLGLLWCTAEIRMDALPEVGDSWTRTHVCWVKFQHFNH